MRRLVKVISSTFLSDKYQNVYNLVFEFWKLFAIKEGGVKILLRHKPGAQWGRTGRFGKGRVKI